MILNGLSGSAVENGDYPEAKRAATLITEFYPNKAEGWANLAVVLSMAGDVGEAITAADRAIKLDPANVRSHMIKESCVELQRLGKAKGPQGS